MHGSLPPRRRRLRLPWQAVAVVTAAVTAVGVAAAGASAAASFADDFEDGNSSGWSKSGGSWSVVSDGSSVLRQTNTAAGLARVFVGQTDWTDYAVQARVKPLGWDAAGFAGVAARSAGSTSFDRLVLFAGRAELQAVRSGTVTVLGSASVSVPAGSWATLRLEAGGGTVRALVNGTVVGQGVSQSAQGRVGLQTYRATASFDDVVVDGGVSPEPTASSASPSPSVPRHPHPPPRRRRSARRWWWPRPATTPTRAQWGSRWPRCGGRWSSRRPARRSCYAASVRADGQHPDHEGRHGGEAVHHHGVQRRKGRADRRGELPHTPALSGSIPGRARRVPHRGLLLADLGPGDRERAVRDLLRRTATTTSSSG